MFMPAQPTMLGPMRTVLPGPIYRPTRMPVIRISWSVYIWNYLGLPVDIPNLPIVTL